MTAEIAILNKSAVALATDSAVTISAGAEALKIFESADKLFELSKQQPIGIMIYNGMQFMGVPFETIVKNFRKNCAVFDTVSEASEAFLKGLYEYVDNAPEEEIARSIRNVVGTVASEISERIEQAALNAISKARENGGEDKDSMIAAIFAAVKEVIEAHQKFADELEPARFIKREVTAEQTNKHEELVRAAVKESISGFSETHLDEILEISSKLLASSIMSPQKTGIVFSGFGEIEVFPTMIAFEIDGLFNGQIRLIETDRCDIDRNGKKAYVRPFAQKDMVDRFLHGLDDALREDIQYYCEETLDTLLSSLVDSVCHESDAREDLLQKTDTAKKAFLKGLSERAFLQFETRSRREIEDMVEFMPKPELAKMAEALIDLTSIKRKVTQGLETVGGPVDVAVISKNDGFVWVKRKHYFPSELNAGFLARTSVKNIKGGQ